MKMKRLQNPNTRKKVKKIKRKDEKIRDLLKHFVPFDV